MSAEGKIDHNCEGQNDQVPWFAAFYTKGALVAGIASSASLSITSCTAIG